MSTLSVLLVDDDEATCNMFKLVGEHYGWQLTTMRDAESALTYLNNSVPDVIVLDIFLPQMDGYQALQKIRSNTAASKTAVIATTAYYTFETRTELMARGFNGYLPKPLAPASLADYLQQIVEQN